MTNPDAAASAREFAREVLLELSNRAWTIGFDAHREMNPVERAAFDQLAEACDRILFLQGAYN
jgi:hypothetical protein